MAEATRNPSLRLRVARFLGRAGRRFARYSPSVVVISSILLVWMLLEVKKNAARDSAEQAAIGHGATLARALEEEFLRTIGTVDQSLRYIREAYVRAPANFRIEDWQQGGRFVSQAALQIGMTDARGMLLSTSLTARAPVDLSDREHIRVHLDGTEDTLFISKPILGRVSQKWSIQLSRRMEYPDGRLAGVIVGSLDVAQLEQFHTNVLMGTRGTITIVGDDGIVRVRSPHNEEGIGRDLRKSESWRELPGSDNAVSTFRARSTFDNVERIYVSRRIRGTAMRVTVGQALEDVVGATAADAEWHVMSGTLASIWMLTLFCLMLWYQRGLARERDRADAAREAKARFLAVMSHEIRTPLNGVLGLADILAETARDQRQSALVETLKTSAQHLQRLLNDILDFSRLEAGRIDFESVPFAIQNVAREAMDLLRPGARAKGLALALDIAPDIAPAHVGDPDRLRQILINLVGNGIKFTESGAVSVTIRARTAPDPARQRLVITVEDTGCGIPGEALDRLFRDFSQVDAAVGRRYGGVGLGLAISDKLVRAMGGTIGVTSAPGSGSRFEVVLDLPTGDAAALRELAAPPPAPALKPLPFTLRVLVAEDNATSRQILTEQLTALGQKVETVTDGAQAVEIVRQERFDVVLMDIEMPMLDGLEACRRIRAAGGPAGSVRIFALTAHVEDEMDAAAAAGMDGFLAKPLDRAGLVAFLESENAFRTAADPTLETLPAPASRPAAEDSAATLAELGWDIGADGLESVLDIFVGECAVYLRELRAAGGEGEFSTVHRIAHSLKGSASGLGFQLLANAAEELERDVKAGAHDKIPAHLDRIEAECAVVWRAIADRPTSRAG